MECQNSQYGNVRSQNVIRTVQVPTNKMHEARFLVIEAWSPSRQSRTLSNHCKELTSIVIKRVYLVA